MLPGTRTCMAVALWMPPVGALCEPRINGWDLDLLLFCGEMEKQSYANAPGLRKLQRLSEWVAVDKSCFQSHAGGVRFFDGVKREVRPLRNATPRHHESAVARICNLNLGRSSYKLKNRGRKHLPVYIDRSMSRCVNL
ncbi:hypothetical protein ACLOJK_010588 [Asimina triloba]